MLTPSGSNASVLYSLSGATTGSGNGSASGTTFNKGLTAVTYSLVADPRKTCSFTVTVKDTAAPAITNVSATPSILWPPNHKMQEVTINYTLTDNCGNATASLSVSSNESQSVSNSSASQDWQVIDAHHVFLRAERSGKGTDRIYTILIQAVDAAGNTSTQTVTVVVPHDNSNNKKYGERKEREAKGLSVQVFPNPSTTSFTIVTTSNSDHPIAVKVMDAVGRMVEVKSKVSANGTVTIGEHYRPGIYYAEVAQGNERVVVKLIKQAE